MPDALIDYVCHQLFNPPPRVAITAGEVSMIIEIFGRDGRLGELIGRRGRMARALRELAMAAGNKHGLRVYLSVWEG